MALDLGQATLAVGALGSSATALVDTTKVFSGGISRAGLRYIKAVIARLVLVGGGDGAQSSGMATADILDTLRANWMNGMSLDTQKSAAKSLIKLHFNTATAPLLAKQTNVSSTLLVQVAAKLPTAQPLTLDESDTYGRFDIAVTALVDQAYQRADQFYRNSCKFLAAVFAVALAVVADQQLGWTLPHWEAVLIGIIATPLAPVAKDLSSAIAAGAKALQSMKG